MYYITSKLLGDYESICLTSENEKDQVCVIPGIGACMTQLRLHEVDLLDGYTTAEGLTAFKWSKSAILAPFPNRMLDGRYSWKGNNYQFPLNEVNNNHAIHGFLRKASMQIKAAEANSERALLTCTYDYDGSYDYYPFPFQLTVSFELSGTGLTVSIGIKNTGIRTIPVGTGWHPYFSFGGKVDDLLLKMPKAKKVPVDERMIPMGERQVFHDFDELKQIGNTVLDNCFELEQQTGRAELLLQNVSHQLRYWQESGTGNFPFIQVFTPPHRESIAVEPMSCNVDAFNNGEGLISLGSGEVMEGKCGVELRVL